MTPTEYPTLHERLVQIADALHGKAPTQAGMALWVQTLKEFAFADVSDQLDAWAKRSTKMPAPADIWKPCFDVRADRLEATAQAEKRDFRLESERTFRRSDRIGRELRALALALRNEPARDPKEWAYVLWERFIADRPNPSGQPMSQIQIQFACEALRRPLQDAYAAREERRQGLAA